MNLLIVDDQEQVLNGIRSSIDWEKVPQIENIYYAQDAKEAKNFFLKYNVDILITDIEMPGENGLELISWVSANFEETKCILLTAHANFDYAQDAIRLKAMDYILQPVRYEKLVEAVTKAVRQILQERAELSPDSKQIFWDNFHDDAERLIFRNFFAGGSLGILLKKAEKLNVPLSINDDYTLILVDETLESSSLDKWAEGENKSMLLSLARYFFGQLTDYLCVFEQYSHHFWMLLHSQDKSEDFKISSLSFIEFCRENYQISAVIYLGERKKLGELPKTYQKLYQMYLDNVAFIKKLYLSDGEEELDRIDVPMPSSSSWTKYFDEQTTELIESALNQYIIRTKESGKMSSRLLLLLQQTFLNAFYESLRARGARIQNIFEQKDLFEAYTLSTRSIEDFQNFVQKICAFNRTFSQDSAKDTDSIVEAAQNYVSSHLFEELSRDRIAHEIHVSESYLSHLFPKIMGISLTDYIIQERMSLAKSLLKGSTLPVQIIAIKVGYNNISYFIRTFKKTYGLTPNDYRKNTDRS